MNCMEWCIVVLVAGFVSAMELIVIFGCINKFVDTKIKAKKLIDYKIYKEEMKILYNGIDRLFDRVKELKTTGKRPMTKVKRDNKVPKEIADFEKDFDEKYFDDEIEDDEE